MHKLKLLSRSSASPSPISNLFSFVYPSFANNKHYTFISFPARLKPHRNSILIKGPQLYNQLVPLVSKSLDPRDDPTNCNSMQLNPFKNCMKSYLLRQQSQGEADEWSIDNFGMYTGSRRSERIAELDP